MLRWMGRGRAPLVLAFALAGCGGNVPVSRGLGSHEVLAVRDSSIKLRQVTDVQGQDPVLVYTTQGDGDAGAPTYWSLDLVTGALQNLGGQPPDSTPAAPTSTGRYSCQYPAQADGSFTIQVTDNTTGVETDLADTTTLRCPSDDGFLAIFRPDPSNSQNLILWSGPYQQLAMVALPIDVHRLVSFRSGTTAAADGGAPVPSPAVVLASPAGQPSALGIYSIDITSNQVTTVVPPTLASAAWADGAAPAGSLQSGGLSPSFGVSRFNGHYIYARAMSDGGTTLFAGPFDGGPASELAFFQLSGIAMPVLGQGVRAAPPDDAPPPAGTPALASWQLDDQSGASPSQLLVWDDTDARVIVCPSTPAVLQGGVFSADGSHVLFRAVSTSNTRNFGPLQLVTMGPNGPESCAQLIDDEVFWADISGDGSMLAWIAKTEVGSNTNIWIANGDGSGEQMLFIGTVNDARFITGTSKLELSYGGDLVVLDLHDLANPIYVAEQLFGAPTTVNDSWFVAGYDFSTQDSSGTLGAINVQSGKKIQISPAVAQYAIGAQILPNDSDMLANASPVTTGVYHVAYLVRGRNPSSQDGIWVASFNAADLQ